MAEESEEAAKDETAPSTSAPDAPLADAAGGKPAPPANNPRVVAALVLVLAAILIGGGIGLTKEWNDRNKSSTGPSQFVLTTVALRPGQTTTLLGLGGESNPPETVSPSTTRPPQGEIPLVSVVLHVNEVRTLHNDASAGSWSQLGTDTSDATGSAATTECGGTTPAIVHWHGRQFQYQASGSNSRGHLVNEVFQFASPDDAQAYVAARQTATFQTCLTSETRAKLTRSGETPSGSTNETHLGLAQGTTGYRLTTSTAASLSTCVDSNDFSWTAVGAYVIYLQADVCDSPWSATGETKLIQLLIPRLGG